ncbi:SOS response-associated peptidase [Bifidobacterium sp. ESL0704]|uniref:SOS response-associated peptidase n=1 Tax=Bifidobacterium sp. ESL0704 TaxID=2983219 RepID=UPI0023F94F29|nr:SOS response-associated peptidase [Bifidobacterium sp. ESL0704]WEV52184.1 SOS response-associated peptidase [Bifidobacterium sp. ESL0704]
MCRRFSLDLDWNTVASDFGVDDEDVDTYALPARTFRVEPKQTIVVLAAGEDGRRHLSGGYWSLVPSYSDKRELTYPTYNARMETAAQKPTFKDAMRSRRAIIPASGYFEFKGRRPFYFHAQGDAMLAMAGLFSWWRDNADSPWTLTATILTCDAIEEAAKIHNRMPLLVSRDMTGQWLDRHVDGSGIIDDIHAASLSMSENLDCYEVAEPAPEEDGPRCIRPKAERVCLSLF